ncbi:Tho complex subunit 7-domain-containing protein [Hyaloraphidium curvatum]|nr:Tho complex subunit 7-domain-containing protein [Hyaloraphidium curvatum]
MEIEPSPIQSKYAGEALQLPDITDEDTLIHLRLVANERPRKGLMKQFTLFQKFLRENKLEEARLALDICLKEVDDLRIASLKNRYTSRMVSREVDRYRHEQARIEGDMQAAKDEIEGLKRRLERAQEERKNKAEYDELAKKILKIPERRENERQIQQLQEELNLLLKEGKQLDDEWELRKKQFTSLLCVAQQLRTIIAESKQRAEEEAARDLEKPIASVVTPIEAAAEEEEGAVDQTENAMDIG